VSKVVLNAIADEQTHTTRIIYEGDEETIVTDPGEVMPSQIEVGDQLVVERPSEDELILRILESSSETHEKDRDRYEGYPSSDRNDIYPPRPEGV
jgi:hypothetical protein